METGQHIKHIKIKSIKISLIFFFSFYLFFLILFRVFSVFFRLFSMVASYVVCCQLMCSKKRRKEKKNTSLSFSTKIYLQFIFKTNAENPVSIEWIVFVYELCLCLFRVHSSVSINYYKFICVSDHVFFFFRSLFFFSISHVSVSILSTKNPVKLCFQNENRTHLHMCLSWDIIYP